MTRHAVKTINTIYVHRRTMSLLMLALSIGLFGFYLYSLARTVANGIELGAIQGEVETIKRSISELDESFLAKEKIVTMDLAHEKGFVSADISLFIDRDAVGGLSFNNAR